VQIMEYMLLIYHNEDEATQRPEAEKQRIFQEFAAFTQDVMKSGKRKAGGSAQVHPVGGHSSRARRQDDGDGRTVRGNQGSSSADTCWSKRKISTRRFRSRREFRRRSTDPPKCGRVMKINM